MKTNEQIKMRKPTFNSTSSMGGGFTSGKKLLPHNQNRIISEFPEVPKKDEEDTESIGSYEYMKNQPINEVDEHEDNRTWWDPVTVGSTIPSTMISTNTNTSLQVCNK